MLLNTIAAAITTAASQSIIILPMDMCGQIFLSSLPRTSVPPEVAPLTIIRAIPAPHIAPQKIEASSLSPSYAPISPLFIASFTPSIISERTPDTHSVLNVKNLPMKIHARINNGTFSKNPVSPTGHCGKR